MKRLTINFPVKKEKEHIENLEKEVKLKEKAKNLDKDTNKSIAETLINTTGMGRVLGNVVAQVKTGAGLFGIWKALASEALMVAAESFMKIADANSDFAKTTGQVADNALSFGAGLSNYGIGFEKLSQANATLFTDMAAYSNLNKDIQWNFPIERKNVSLINDTAIIGSALIPRYFFDFKPGFNYDLINDKNYDPDVLFPANVLNLIYLNQDLTYNEPIKKYQYHTGIGSGLNGLNQGTVYTDLFQASDFIDKGNGNNFYGESRTYNFGDNSDGPLNLSLYAIELAKSKQATANGYGVHGRYTQAINETYTWGPFISSTDSKNSFPVLQTEIYDITDELQDLIDNKVYTSYGFYTGNVAPSSFDAEISNRFKGNFYYFGLWEGANSLITIEKNYFKTNE